MTNLRPQHKYIIWTQAPFIYVTWYFWSILENNVKKQKQELNLYIFCTHKGKKKMTLWILILKGVGLISKIDLLNLLIIFGASPKMMIS